MGHDNLIVMESVPSMEGAYEAEQQVKDPQRDMDLTPAQASGKHKRSLSITAKSAVDNPSDRKKPKQAAISSSLLCSPWMHIDFILEAQQAWADKYAAGRCYRHYKDTWYDDERIWLDLEHGAWENNYDARYIYRLHALQHERGSLKFNSRACFEADYERARQLPPKPERFSPDRIWGTSDTLIDIRMPIDLITGPWDEEKKTRRLFWMRRAGVSLRTDPPSHLAYSSEVKLACLDAAVICAENPDPLIINCLIGLWIFFDLPEDDRQKRRVQLCNRIERASDPPNMMGEVQRDLFYMTYPGEPGDDMDPYERWYGDGD
ncbi:hypothetical protein E4U52_002014 [Claviceps spartinae]|nr:hypothetical protein E4U52_002014 [Claviceps spartinae]